jgi:hypothetical protein
MVESSVPTLHRSVTETIESIIANRLSAPLAIAYVSAINRAFADVASRTLHRARYRHPGITLPAAQSLWAGSYLGATGGGLLPSSYRRVALLSSWQDPGGEGRTGGIPVGRTVNSIITQPIMVLGCFIYQAEPSVDPVSFCFRLQTEMARAGGGVMPPMAACVAANVAERTGMCLRQTRDRRGAFNRELYMSSRRWPWPAGRVGKVTNGAW